MKLCWSHFGIYQLIIDFNKRLLKTIEMFAQTSYKQQKIHRCTHGTRLFQSYYAQWNFVHHRLYINQALRDNKISKYKKSNVY